MAKFCGNCGKEMSDEQRFCSNCGKEFVNNINQTVYSNTNMNSYTYNNSNNNFNPVQSTHNTYKLVVGILMILLCGSLLLAGLSSYEDNAIFIFIFPGILGMVSAVMTICSRNNHGLLKPAGIIFIVSAGINFLAIYAISIYAILAIVFGVLNIMYCKKI